ncbi:hypothetical protein EON81_28320 [bacterium]|nr:MAG: hypothetical protein EON81_28320 [bacterium]
MKINTRIILVPLIVAPMALLAGCSNVGDTNPTSPEEMEKIRQKQSSERETRQPADSRPPAGN